jgi:hypothetical protein
MRAPLLCLPLAIATLVGCAGTVPPQGDSDAEATGSATAVVVVERTASATAAGDSTRAEAVARFVRMRSGAVDDDALRMVGAAVDFPALGSCAQLARTPGASAPVRSIALVDVGAVSIESAGVRTSLLPRSLPDVADVVSGVVYAARLEKAASDALPARGRYTVRASGSPDLDVPPFTVLATAPAEPSDVRIAGSEAGATAIDVTAATAAPTVDLAWEAATASADDLIYVDIGGATASPVVRCLFTDAGHASIPSAAFGAIAPSDEGTLTVHRLHRDAFRAAGVDPGEVRFDFARAVAVTRR